MDKDERLKQRALELIEDDDAVKIELGIRLLAMLDDAGGTVSYGYTSWSSNEHGEPLCSDEK